MEQEIRLNQQKEIPKQYPKGMIFDMDGTLIINPDFYKRIYSTSLNETVFEACGQTGLDTLTYYRENFEGKGELALGALGIPFLKWANKLAKAPIDDVISNPELVTRLRATPGKKALFTGSPKALAYRLLIKVGFDPEKDFDLIVGWEEPELSPLKWNCSPFVFRAICQKLEINPEDIWAIGDNWESDLLPAQKLGATAVQINKTTGTPDYRFATVEDMIDAVEQQRRVPYVISGDIRITLDKWLKRVGLTSPSPEFFKTLRKDFKEFFENIFSQFELVEEDEIISGLQTLIGDSRYPVVTLDGNYFPSDYAIEVSRSIDENKQNRGLRRRPGTLPLRSQLTKTDELLQGSQREINLVDDVGFSGELLERVITLLQRKGFEVKGVYLGIGVQEAIDRVEKMGIPVKSVRTYTQVVDQVCERDFYPGVPQSGRPLVGNKNIGAPYILPFGNPEAWASIPKEAQRDLSCFCLQQSIRLFEEIERVSGRILRCCDMDRLPIGIQNDESRFVDRLKEISATL